MKNDEVILISNNSKLILNKFNSLKNEFLQISFIFIDYEKDHSYDNIITCLPSWIIKINSNTDIVSGDVLIKPLRSFIKNKLKENYGEKS